MGARRFTAYGVIAEKDLQLLGKNNPSASRENQFEKADGRGRGTGIEHSPGKPAYARVALRATDRTQAVGTRWDRRGRSFNPAPNRRSLGSFRSPRD
jgi:hypothetical protein